MICDGVEDEEESPQAMESDGSYEHVSKVSSPPVKGILKGSNNKESSASPRNVSFRFVIADFVEPVPVNVINEEEYANVVVAYEELCAKLRVRPCRQLLDQLHGLQDSTLKLDTIDLKGARLDSAHCEALEAVLRVLRAQTLNIEQTQLDDDGAISLFEMIEYYEPVTRLIVANNVKLGVRAWLALARLLKRFHRLEYLDVRRTSLDESTMPLLCRALKLNCNLRVLHLEDNHLSGILTRNLVWGLRTNKMLQDLFLGHNRLTPEDAKLLGSLLITNHTIRLLDLRNNRLQDTGIIFLASALEEQHAGLQLITVWSNQITANSMTALSRALAFHTTLEGVNLGSNALGNKGVAALKEGLLSSRSIARLVMASCNITDEGAVVMAEIVGDHTTLIHLDLRENNITLAGVLALKCAFQINTKLLRLHLDVMKKNNQDDLMVMQLEEIERYSVRNLELHKHNDQALAARLQDSGSATTDSSQGSKEESGTRSLQEQVDYQLAVKLQGEEERNARKDEKRPLPILSPTLASPQDPTKTFGFFSGSYMKLKARWDENVAVYLNRADVSLAASPGNDIYEKISQENISTDEEEDQFEDAVEDQDKSSTPNHVLSSENHVTPNHVTSQNHVTPDDHVTSEDNADFDEVWYTGPETDRSSSSSSNYSPVSYDSTSSGSSTNTPEPDFSSPETDSSSSRTYSDSDTTPISDTTTATSETTETTATSVTSDTTPTSEISHDSNFTRSCSSSDSFGDAQDDSSPSP